MSPKLKTMLAKGFKYFYGVTLLTFFISILMLIANLGLKRRIDWNGVLILYGILVIALVVFKLLSRKLQEKDLE